MTKKKFAKLELSLLHLQPNVEIPETHLLIQRAVSEALATNTRPSLSHIPPKTPKRLHFPTHTPRTRQLVDQIHTGRDGIE
jgi:hypothetical protein